MGLHRARTGAADPPDGRPAGHDPSALAVHYSRFRVADRLPLTGHSHQAWPDVALDGQVEAFTDAAEHTDDKWGRAFDRADRVRAGLSHMLGDDARGTLTLADSTHTLLVRLLSSLDLRARPRVVTTDAEFHSARRQLARLGEVGVEVVRVPSLDPDGSEAADSLAERLAAEVDDRTSVVLVSAVLFSTGRVVPDLGRLARSCRSLGTALVVDSYHSLGALDWTLAAHDLHDAFVVGGGYKYLQQGEGVCFLRWPTGCALRPVVTGWFAEFGQVHAPPLGGVGFGDGPERFAGATYDPTSHYRAARVLDFFDAQGMTPGWLQAVSRYQVGRLSDAFDALGVDPALLRRALVGPPEQRAGFLALRSPDAAELQAGLLRRGVRTDHRGDVLRLGPAPYLRDDQLDRAVELLGEAAREVGAR